MLATLHIENIAVIKCVDIDLTDGFTVLTGETGAGKSILIDSVNLLLGGKFTKDLIRAGESRAYVSGMFCDLSEEARHTLEELGFAPDEQDGTLMLTRAVQSDGKSTLRIGGRPASASVVREVGKLLLNIHGQNDNQRLLQKSSHLQLLDAMDDISAPLKEYEEAYRALIGCRQELEQLTRSDAEKERLREMLTYQIRDVEAVKLKSGEEEALLRQRERLQNLEKIKKNVSLVVTALDSREKNGSVAYLLGRSSLALRQLAAVIPEAQQLSDQLDGMMYEVRDIADTVEGWLDEDVDDPTARLDALEGRLESISRLKKKYGATVEEVLAFRDKAKAELDALETAQDRCEALAHERDRLVARCRALAAVLTERRGEIAAQITERIREELAFLDMPKVRFAVSIRPTSDFTPSGCDDVEFLIATNPGQELMPMIKIASGGELSRLMLAIKSVLNDRDGVGCVVFDEIDTGISGKTSRKVGIRLRQMAQTVQVICITHSAQIASLADTHALISKQEVGGRMETEVRVLDDEGRVEEIARILGGIEITAVQRDAAREMIDERWSI